MSVVEIALKRPYTVVAVLILVTLMGIGAALRMPIDIFPEIDIPVAAVVWTYNGLTPQALGVTRIICPECQAAIEESGGVLTSPSTAIWP